MKKKKPALKSSLPLTESVEERWRRQNTHPGQADWAVPGRRSCRECNYWGPANRNSDGTLRRAPCRKATMLSGNPMEPVPHFAAACKYFEENALIPEVFKK